VTTFEVVKWVHLLAAAVWTGGLIVLAFLVLAIRRVTDDREILQAAARMFGVVSWSAMGIAVVAGTWLYTEWGLPWNRFVLKGSLIAIAIVLAFVHQLTARRTSAAVRGVVQLVIVIVSIGIFGAAVSLV
jgi:putative copper export protein